MFITNAWYVAAWARDLKRELLPVTILDQAVVLYRALDGAPVALEDSCPHRRLPLSMGRLRDDRVECGYHGLTFDRTGACVRAPLTDLPPARARVRSYPVTEKYGLVWIWMGAPAQADPAGVVQIEHWDAPGWGLNAGDSMVVECDYRLITDNLLDPSHVAWVHDTSFAGADCDVTPLNTEIAEQSVVVWRWMTGVEVAPFYQPLVGFAGRCDRRQEYRVSLPSIALSRAVFAPAGAGAPEGRPHPETAIMDSYSFLTPIDAHRTRYFWMQLRNASPDDEALSARLGLSVRAAFEEDRRVLEAVDKGLRDHSGPSLNLAMDAGPLQFRKLVEAAIRRETRAPDA